MYSFLSIYYLPLRYSLSKSNRVFAASVFILFARHASDQWFPPHVKHFLLANAIHQEYEQSVMTLKLRYIEKQNTYPTLSSEMRNFCS